MSSVSELISNHYNSLKDCGLKARNNSNILFLRNFNNWIKSNLVQNYIAKISTIFNEISVLDLGSGKGGDQIKWAKGRVSHVTFLDIAELSVHQSKERYHKGKFQYSADFFVKDFTRDDFQSIIKRSYHIVSCQFAFHYSFESYDQVKLTFKNISNCLHKKGYFIGTTINAFEVMKRLKNCENDCFGNDIYKVSFLSDLSKSGIPLFGAKYDFYLEGSVNCPEFMIYPPLMDKIAEENNLKLIQRCSFPEFYKTNVLTDQGRELISRIKAFQEISLKDIDNISTTEYPDIREYIKQTNCNSVLTMSKSEWEVVQLYDVFVYQKI